ncbi:MAG: acyl-CoA synthetase FdrA [Desulfobacterales bacterium]|nr:acyl-CoA synthetase FdrA [Desulfobacterales bacterium]
MARSTHILNSSYYDSVVLMRVASQLKRQDGVTEVAMFMGTEGNHALLAQVGLTTVKSKDAGPQDLLIIVVADTEVCAESTTQEAIRMLNERVSGQDSELDYRPRTLDTALGFLPDATLATLSIPGEFAAREGSRCIDRGLNVFLFSDNVEIEDEISLKNKARKKNLLCMGPDCGTAYINGVGLGFANVIKSGRVGCIAASGTGLQAVVCELDRLGEGVSHGIGVGGRDLSREVNGIMTKYALELLEQDPATEVIILLSKPPHADVIAMLESLCSVMKTPIVTCFQGARLEGDTYVQASTLDEAAAMAACLVNGSDYVAHSFTEPQRVSALLDRGENKAAGKRVVGLFTGGTLAKEAQILLSKDLGFVAKSLEEESTHSVVDLGDDQYTIGRPHPMIAPEARTEKLVELAQSGGLASCGVVLVDLVLGNGSHLDPAGELIESIKILRNSYKLSSEIVAVVIGTEMDPQDVQGQIRGLEGSGITVFRSNSEAARYAAMLAVPESRTHYMTEAP